MLPTKLLWEQVIHPAPPIFFCTFLQIFWATSHTLVSQVCYHSATQFSQFDVSFPESEKLLKIVATRGEIFSLKFTKYRLAAGLRPDLLAELKHSPNPLATIRGPTSKGREAKGGEKR